MKTRNYYSFFRFISGNYELIVVLLNGLLSEPLVACIMNGLHHSHSPQYREVLRLFFSSIGWSVNPSVSELRFGKITTTKWVA